MPRTGRRTKWRYIQLLWIDRFYDMKIGAFTINLAEIRGGVLTDKIWHFVFRKCVFVRICQSEGMGSGKNNRNTEVLFFYVVPLEAR